MVSFVESVDIEFIDHCEMRRTALQISFAYEARGRAGNPRQRKNRFFLFLG